MKRCKFLLKLAVVGNALLLVGLFVCYRAGTFNWLMVPSPPPVDLENEAPESNVSAGSASENVAGDPKKEKNDHPISWNWWSDPKTSETTPPAANALTDVTLFNLNSGKSGPVFHPLSPPPKATQQPPAAAKRTMLPGSKSAEVFDPSTPPPLGP